MSLHCLLIQTSSLRFSKNRFCHQCLLNCSSWSRTGFQRYIRLSCKDHFSQFSLRESIPGHLPAFEARSPRGDKSRTPPRKQSGAPQLFPLKLKCSRMLSVCLPDPFLQKIGGGGKQKAKKQISDQCRPCMILVAPAAVLSYLNKQNRPYSAIDIFNNLHKEYGKTVSRSTLCHFAAPPYLTHGLDAEISSLF